MNTHNFLKLSTVIATLIFSSSSFATYCSLKTPQYCPDKGGNTVNNNINNKNYNNFNNSNKNYLNQNQYQKQLQNQTAIGKASATATANSSSTSGASISGMNGNGGQSNVTTGDVSTSFNSTQVRQTPFAYSPGLSSSFSQENCANSASVGVSAGFGAIGGGVPIQSDDCNRRRDAQMWAAFGQNRIACERMAQSPENQEAMRKAGVDCAYLTREPAGTSDWLKRFKEQYPLEQDNKPFDQFHNQQMAK